MAVVIVPAPRQEQEAPVPPRADDGSEFTWCMFFRGFDSVAYAHSCTELVDVLVPGYALLSAHDQLASRIHLAQQHAVWAQAQVWADCDQIPTDAQSQMLAAPRLGEQAPTGPWSGPAPLVVLANAYAPYSGIPAPHSVGTDAFGQSWVWMVDPQTEETLLTSLHEVGAIRLLHRERTA